MQVPLSITSQAAKMSINLYAVPRSLEKAIREVVGLHVIQFCIGNGETFLRRRRT